TPVEFIYSYATVNLISASRSPYIKGRRAQGLNGMGIPVDTQRPVPTIRVPLCRANGARKVCFTGRQNIRWFFQDLEGLADFFQGLENFHEISQWLGKVAVPTSNLWEKAA
ncbi:MAG: hypothetical protein NTY53_23930, partial [Kiritimatiellaeota bacterium]|nr:hypothetical protein [Kiritimatiellota bacterium]